MGATASRDSSPSLPAKYRLMETRSTTRLFTVPDYSKCVLMPAGSAVLFETLGLLDRTYSIEVYPAGYHKDGAEFIAVLVEPTESTEYRHKDASKILIEILHGSEEQSTVFDNHTARASGEEEGYFLVKRKELEASGCVRNDKFTIRCTVSLDVKVARSRAEVMEALSRDASSSEPVVSGSHTLTIGSFSKIKAALRTGECVHSTQFSLGGSSWYFNVYPNGHSDDSTALSIFLGRGRSHELTTVAEFSFEIVGVREEPPPFTECTFDHNNPEYEFPYYVFCEMDGDHDRLVLRCHLNVIKVTTPSLLSTEVDDVPV